ncbi:MAG: DUF4167 domain-containing protein [Roseovarius sp.]|nr:DUF4167 domain-containing protein [Roseovarius sp.]
MRPSKSRSRSKPSRNRTMGNVINRVFDSSGPEGKVRGTPQQIIDKYNQLARDAQLSGDRVAAENFQQHAEHYLRLLSTAQKEQETRREEQERQSRDRQAERDRERAKRQERESNGGEPDEGDGKPDALETGFVDAEGDSGLVETPESQAVRDEAAPPQRPKTRKPRSKPRSVGGGGSGDGETGGPPREAAE